MQPPSFPTLPLNALRQNGRVVLAIACATIAMMVFLPGLGGGFLFDDKPNIVQNSGVHLAGLDHYSLWRAASSFPGAPGLRPLSMLSLALDYWVHGLDPIAFKATNLIIHAGTTVALASLFRLLLLHAGRTPRVAAFTALAMATAWAVHPLQVSSVLYIVQRMQTLATLFVVLGLWSYVRARRAQITGRPAHRDWIRAAVFWGLGMLSKEDAILLPAYAFLVELLVLRFEAANAAGSRLLRGTWLLLLGTGIATYLLLVVPHYWSWQTIGGRDFSTPERLLTQARVLVMYLGQIFWPWPDRMPFYYDDFKVSHGLLQPPSTLLSLLLVSGLLSAAWLLRRIRPLFSLGILLFFAGHFITSNVINLELVFEHRNYFPLAGIVLATGDLMTFVHERLRLRAWGIAAMYLLPVALLSVATSTRAWTWGDALRLARNSTELAPGSIRAWSALCRAHYDLSQGKPANPHFDKAIEACRHGGTIGTSAALLANVVILKTIRGDVTQVDWDRYLANLETVTMNVENAGTAINFVNNARRRVPGLNPWGIERAIDIVSRRSTVTAADHAAFGMFLLAQGNSWNRAAPHFANMIADLGPDDPLVRAVRQNLAQQNRQDWAEEFEGLLQRSGKFHAVPAND